MTASSDFQGQLSIYNPADRYMKARQQCLRLKLSPRHFTCAGLFPRDFVHIQSVGGQRPPFHFACEIGPATAFWLLWNPVAVNPAPPLAFARGRARGGVYSLDYVADEKRAHRAGLRFWSGSFEMPWGARQRRQ